jgi:hypothetical protein
VEILLGGLRTKDWNEKPDPRNEGQPQFSKDQSRKKGIKKPRKNTGLAERKGFEPSIPFRGIHTFQACSFNHSDTSLRDRKSRYYSGTCKSFFKFRIKLF